MAKKKFWNKFCKGEKQKCNNSCGGCAYFLGFLGTAVYYVQTAPTFWTGVWGVVKAVVWPAILAYKLFGFLG